MKFLLGAFVVGFVSADPTKALVQSAVEVKPHGSFIQESEHDRLARKTEASKRVFLEAMRKLQADEQMFEREEKESDAKAHKFHDMASSSFISV
jgi:hypothetical protein